MGIDIEQITDRDECTVAATLTDAERRLLDGDRLLVAAGERAPNRWAQTAMGAEPEPYAVAWTPLEEADHAPEQIRAHAGGHSDDA